MVKMKSLYDFTLKELQDYIEGDASAAAQMAQNIQTNANDIDALEAIIKGVSFDNVNKFFGFNV